MRRITSGYWVFMLLAGIASAPSAAAQGASLRRIDVCVVADGKLQQVAADYNPATGDTTVAGRPFAAAHPSRAPHYAGTQPWYVENQIVSADGLSYTKYGLPRILTVSGVVPRGAYRGVPLFVEPGASAPAEVFYAPVRTGCEFQPYQVAPGLVGEINVGETRTGTLV